MSSPVPSAPSPIDPEGGPAEVPATGGQEESCAQQHDLGSDVALNAPETVQLQAQQAPDAAAGPSNGGMINPAAPRYPILHLLRDSLSFLIEIPTIIFHINS